MFKVKRILITLSVIFVSFFFIDEGKTFLLIANSIETHLNHNQTNDLEIPHQHSFNKHDDDTKWMNSSLFELSCSYKSRFLFPLFLNKITKDYTGLIWQPPRSL